MRLALCLLPLLAACASYNVQVYGSFDRAQKTMTVTQGGSGLSGYLKTRLRDAGWQLAVDAGPEVTRGTVADGQIDTVRGGTFRTRYRMQLWAECTSVLLSGRRMYVYDISIVDNESGAELLTMAGEAIDYKIADRLLMAISQNEEPHS